MTIKDIISPTAWFVFKTLGYGLLFVAWGVLIAAGCRLYADGQAAYKRSRWY